MVKNEFRRTNKPVWSDEIAEKSVSSVLKNSLTRFMEIYAYVGTRGNSLISIRKELFSVYGIGIFIYINDACRY